MNSLYFHDRFPHTGRLSFFSVLGYYKQYSWIKLGRSLCPHVQVFLWW